MSKEVKRLILAEVARIEKHPEAPGAIEEAKFLLCLVFALWHEDYQRNEPTEADWEALKARLGSNEKPL